MDPIFAIAANRLVASPPAARPVVPESPRPVAGAAPPTAVDRQDIGAAAALAWPGAPTRPRRTYRRTPVQKAAATCPAGHPLATVGPGCTICTGADGLLHAVPAPPGGGTGAP